MEHSREGLGRRPGHARHVLSLQFPGGYGPELRAALAILQEVEQQARSTLPDGEVENVHHQVLGDPQLLGHFFQQQGGKARNRGHEVPDGFSRDDADR